MYGCESVEEEVNVEDGVVVSKMLAVLISLRARNDN